MSNAGNQCSLTRKCSFAKFSVVAIKTLRCPDQVGWRLGKFDLGRLAGREILLGDRFSTCCYGQVLAIAFALYDHVEVPAKCSDGAQCHLRPTIGQARGAAEARETAGTQAEESLGENPAIQCALGGKVALVALGPRLDGVRDVVS
jgi:hypothetical protein